MSALLFLTVSGSVLSATQSIEDQVKEIQLENGMTFLLVQRPGAPNIAAGWVAHVGSVNERPGITGISHLFEHMMFKGSDRIGVIDGKLDRKIRKQLDSIRTSIVLLEREEREMERLGRGTSSAGSPSFDEHMQALQDQFARLIQQQRKNLIKDEFDSIYTKAGATYMNAFTTEDLTAYFIQVPKNKMELWFWMESERLHKPIFREFYSERKVVYEERRMRTESTPTGEQDEVFTSLFWRGSAYAWPVVGWPSDISAISRKEAEDYFSVYYDPSNITLALVGDFNQQEAVKLAKQYFGRIRSRHQSTPDVITKRTKQKGQLVYSADVDAPSSVTLVYPTQAFSGKDDPALTVLASILSGRTGRLYRRLVLQETVATQVYANADSKKFAGSFIVNAQAKTGESPEHLQALLLNEIDILQKQGVSDYELEKVKNNISAAKYRQLREPFSLLVQLLYFDGMASWRSMDDLFERSLRVTKEDVQAVAQKYLRADSLAVKLFHRKIEKETISENKDEKISAVCTPVNLLGKVDEEPINTSYFQAVERLVSFSNLVSTNESPLIAISGDNS